MEIIMTVGAPCFPQAGPLAVARTVWFEQVRTAPSGVRRPRAGRPFHGAFANHPIGIDLPVTDRMRRSASEP